MRREELLDISHEFYEKQIVHRLYELYTKRGDEHLESPGYIENSGLIKLYNNVIRAILSNWPNISTDDIGCVGHSLRAMCIIVDCSEDVIPEPLRNLASIILRNK